VKVDDIASIFELEMLELCNEFGTQIRKYCVRIQSLFLVTTLVLVLEEVIE
jgi:hypothetical protein